MRKHFLSATLPPPAEGAGSWLDLEAVATVHVDSEAAEHPVEGALISGGEGWRAAEPGRQRIRIVFDEPRRLSRIHLRFREEQESRTQEFVLGWAETVDGPFRDIVRQQYHFSPPATVEEREEFRVELAGVRALELAITPEIGGRAVCASLARLQIA